MYRFAAVILLSAALAAPVLAQKKDEPKIPTNTFFKGQQSNQYLARERLIGSKIVDKDGQAIGSIDDVIINTNGQVDGVIMGVGGYFGIGEKKIGVRIGALKITTTDGKTTIAFPMATKEMLSAVEAYQRASAAPSSPAKK
jgi:sporulation protein YlmC with PRC-barrel domain